MEKIQIDTEKYLQRFRLFYPDTLFPLDIKGSLKATRCPVCGNRIYQDIKGTGWYCKSKSKHKRFFIRTDIFNEIVK